MTTTPKWRTRPARALVVTAAAAFVAVLPADAQAASAATQSKPDLPPGVVKLADGQPCPAELLCLYRDYGNQGPAYGIRAGYFVDLHALPMAGGVNGPTTADEASSWVNDTDSTALLVDADDGQVRALSPGQDLQEPPETNDTVDLVVWA